MVSDERQSKKLTDGLALPQVRRAATVLGKLADFRARAKPRNATSQGLLKRRDIAKVAPPRASFQKTQGLDLNAGQSRTESALHKSPTFGSPQIDLRFRERFG